MDGLRVPFSSFLFFVVWCVCAVLFELHEMTIHEGQRSLRCFQPSLEGYLRNACVERVENSQSLGCGMFREQWDRMGRKDAVDVY